ncbi:hypothetical protein Hypma_004560 [Hypsizygus marmoreus]|uniref:Uncharacterized protein n=1 Tax=Hypsizygus marmoreus TaxID=39966 RepID=A0A369J7D6_HYPMA|nr:hypothetical protein Hypma_004560 [Hypsizygus marmoreus]
MVAPFIAESPVTKRPSGPQGHNGDEYISEHNTTSSMTDELSMNNRGTMNASLDGIGENLGKKAPGVRMLPIKYVPRLRVVVN